MLGRPEAQLAQVATRVNMLCEVHAKPRVSIGDCAAAALRLGAKRLLLTDPGARRLHMRIALNMPLDDAVYILHNDETFPWMRNLDL